MNFDRAFLVLTGSVGAQIRSALPHAAAAKDVARIAVGVLSEAERVDSGVDQRGEVVTLRWSSGGQSGVAEVVLAVERNGRRKLAPDGKKKIVFLTKFIADQHQWA